jgi:MFS family permease
MFLPPITAEQKANFNHLYADVAWYGVLSGSTIGFLSIYATRLGASGFQVGLLSAGPAVVNLLFSLPAGRWLGGQPLVRSTFLTSVASRIWYLALIPLAWWFSSSQQVWSIVLITLLMSVPGTVVAISFNAVLAEAVPPEWRAHVVGRRNALLAVCISATALLSGWILDQVVFPTNYQIVFALGAFGSLMSSYHLGKLRLPPGTLTGASASLSNDQATPGMARPLGLPRINALRFMFLTSGRPLLRPQLLRGPFGLFMLAYLSLYTFQYVPLPIFPLAYVRELHLTDGAISLGSALFNGMVMVGSLRLGLICRRFGNRWVLVAAALLFGQYPILIGLARDATLFWVASITGGLVYAFLSGAIINRLMERVPEFDRPAYMALHNLIMNLGILAGSLAGPWMADWLGLRQAILVSAGLRLLAGLLLLWWG